MRQKDELIIQSRASNVQLTADLNKANEILLESENRIEQLQSELLSSEEKRRNMESRLSEEIRKNEEIMADYRVELGEKDELVTKLRESLDDMKQRLKRKSDNADLVAFYEEQFHEKDNMIIVYLLHSPFLHSFTLIYPITRLIIKGDDVENRQTYQQSSRENQPQRGTNQCN